jgi:hypothetical protein
MNELKYDTIEAFHIFSAASEYFRKGFSALVSSQSKEGELNTLKKELEQCQKKIFSSMNILKAIFENKEENQV